MDTRDLTTIEKEIYESTDPRPLYISLNSGKIYRSLRAFQEEDIYSPEGGQLPLVFEIDQAKIMIEKGEFLPYFKERIRRKVYNENEDL